MRRLDGVSVLTLIMTVAGGDSWAGPPRRPFCVPADEVEWVASELVPGAQEARLAPTRQRLHRWPAGAGTAWQQRDDFWDAVVLSGRLTLTLDGRRAKTLGRLSYFKLGERTGHKLRCEGPEPCLLLDFAVWSDAPQPYTPDDSLVEGAGVPLAQLTVVDLAAADWAPDPPPDGVEIGWVREIGDWVSQAGRKVPLLPLNGPTAYFIYRLAGGTRLSLNYARYGSYGYTLQGTAVLDFGEGERAMPPGSAFGLADRKGFLECKAGPCIVLATSRPPSWRGR